MNCKVELFLSWLSVLELPYQMYCEIYVCKRYCPYGFFQLGGMLHNVVIFMTKCLQLTAVPSLSFKLKTFASNNIQKQRMHERSYKSLLCLLETQCNVWLLFLDLEWVHGETATAICSQAERKVLNCSIPKPNSAMLAWSWDPHKSSIWAITEADQFSTQFYLFRDSPWFPSGFSAPTQICDFVSNLTLAFLCSIWFAIWSLCLCFVLLDWSMQIRWNRLGLNICTFLVFWNGAFLALSVSCP